MIEVGKEVEGEKILEESLEVAKSISDDGKKSEDLVEISKVLIEVEKRLKAIEGFRRIVRSRKIYKSRLLEIESIIEYFKSIDREWKRGKSLEVAKSISDDCKKSEALFKISKVLIETWKRGRIIRSRQIYK